MVATTDRSCPECDGDVRSTGQETICSSCGLVVTSHPIDHGPEWRSFADDPETPERTGAPLTPSRHDNGLSTEIGRMRHGTPRRRRRMARLRRRHRRARTPTKRDRNQMYACYEINNLVSSLSLPELVNDTACQIFRTAQKQDLLRGRSIEGFASASVYAACRLLDLSRTTDEILEAATATRNEHTAAFKAINRELDVPLGPPDPIEYLPRFASELDVPAEIEAAAREFVSVCRDSGLINGRNPGGVAAACLYSAAIEAEYDLTQRAAANVADVAPVTIRNTASELLEKP